MYPGFEFQRGARHSFSRIPVYCSIASCYSDYFLSGCFPTQIVSPPRLTITAPCIFISVKTVRTMKIARRCSCLTISSPYSLRHPTRSYPLTLSYPVTHRFLATLSHSLPFSIRHPPYPATRVLLLKSLCGYLKRFSRRLGGFCPEKWDYCPCGKYGSGMNGINRV